MLLRALGFNFETRIKETDETYPSYLAEQSIALFVAEKKASAFLNEMKRDELLITADTIVWLENKMLGKPKDKNEAVKMLTEMSGKKHEVFTAVCLTDFSSKTVFSAASVVHFRELSQSEIKYYVNNFNPLDKAGAYGAQECLPKGMNPCSEEEMEFLKSIRKIDLIEQIMNQSLGSDPVSIIQKIEGGFFNVMGLPIVELYEELKDF
jgi:septum formation protein